MRHNQLSFWPVWQLWLFGRNPPAQLVNRIFDEKYVGLNKLQMMPRPNTSNLIEVLNTQALTEKSSDKISLSQNPDKSGRKLVIFTKAWQEWKETCDFTHSLTRVEGNLWFWPKVEIWNCSHGLNSWRIWLIFSPVIRLTRDHNPWTVWPDRKTFFSGPFLDFGREWFSLLDVCPV